jgi:hypothetical protein
MNIVPSLHSCVRIILTGLDNTIIATAIPKITSVFDSLQDVGWYGKNINSKGSAVTGILTIPRFIVSSYNHSFTTFIRTNLHLLQCQMGLHVRPCSVRIRICYLRRREKFRYAHCWPGYSGCRSECPLLWCNDHHWLHCSVKKAANLHGVHC